MADNLLATVFFVRQPLDGMPSPTVAINAGVDIPVRKQIVVRSNAVNRKLLNACQYSIEIIAIVSTFFSGLRSKKPVST